MTSIPRHTAASVLPMKRYRPGYRLQIVAPEIYGAKDSISVRHYPAYITQAKPPANKDLSDVAVFDFDGVINDGCYWLYNHKFNLLRCDYPKQNLHASLESYVHSREVGDFVHYNLLSIFNQTGLTRAQMRQQSLRFFNQVFLQEAFHVCPDVNAELGSVVPSPFVLKHTLDILLQRQAEGKTTIVISGSPRFAIEVFFENLSRFSTIFFHRPIPQTVPLVDFIIGNEPVFDSQEIALHQVERPLPIGDGKRLLVQKLLEVWNIQPKTLAVFTDELLADEPLLGLASAGSQFAVNVRPEERALASERGYRFLDPIAGGPRRADVETLMHKWRKEVVRNFALESLTLTDPV